MTRVNSVERTIWIVGLWHQGLVMAAVFAERGFNVVGLTATTQDVSNLSEGMLPVFEPGLEVAIKSGVASGRIRFAQVSNSPEHHPDLIILAHDTDVDDQDKVQLSQIFSDFEGILNHLSSSVQVLVTAQIPLGTCKKLENLAVLVAPDIDTHMAYMPENLRLGTALERFRNIPLPVIGIRNAKQQVLYSEIFKDLAPEVHFCSIEEAELLKSALNCFLAIGVTFGNEILRIALEYGANANRVIELLQLEPRVGSALPMRPGLAFSGGTLARDVQTIRQIAQDHQVQVPMIEGVWASNEFQKEFFVDYIEEYANRLTAANLGLKPRIGILGLTYKVGTSTLRRSLSIWTAQSLRSRGFEVLVHDPMQGEFDGSQLVNLLEMDSSSQLIDAADLIVVMTPWPEYETLLTSRTEDFATKVLIDPSAKFSFIRSRYPENYLDFVSMKGVHP